MRYAIPSAALAAFMLLSPAHAADPSLAGTWNGSGIAHYTTNRTDRIVCRATYTKSSDEAYRVFSVCMDGDTRYQQSGQIKKAGGNRYTGTIYNEQFNETGQLSVSLRGNSQSVTVTGDKGTVELTLTR